MQTATKEISTEELEALLKERKQKEAQERNEARDGYEKLKDLTVRTLVHRAKKQEADIESFKKEAFSEVETLYELLKEYSKRHKDGKGNFKIEDDSGTLRIKYNTNELGYFDERSQQAEKHIHEFINQYFKEDDPIKELVTRMMERKKGQLDIKLVQRLYAMEDRFDHESWTEGIKLLKESWTPSGSKQYINFYEKTDEGWKQILLNFSAV